MDALRDDALRDDARPPHPNGRLELLPHTAHALLTGERPRAEAERARLLERELRDDGYLLKPPRAPTVDALRAAPDRQAGDLPLFGYRLPGLDERAAPADAARPGC